MSSRWLTWIALCLCWLPSAGADTAAYSVRDAFEALGPAGNGMQSGYQMADFMGRLLLDADLDEPADAFFDFWQQSIRSFDLQALYHSPYLNGTQDGFRAAVFHGRTLPDKYAIRLNSQDRYQQDALAHLGNLGAELGLKQKKSELKDKNSFEARIDAQIALKQFTHGAVANWIDGMQQVIDPENLARLASPRSNVFAGIDGTARRPIDDYYETFPAQTRFFDRYVQLKSFIFPERYQDQAYTRVELEMAPRLAAFKDEFKRLHDYFLKVKRVLRLSIRLKTPDGLDIMSFEMDTRRQSFFWRFNTRQGKLIPCNAAGEPDFSKEFALNTLDRYQMLGVASARVDLYGVHMNTGEATARIDYRRHPEGAVFDLQVADMPTPEIRGRALGVVPLFLVDVVIPSNIEDLARQFVTVMAKGNNGKGSWMKIDWDESQPNDCVLRMQAHTELLDNRFVNIALRLWGKRIHPDPATIEEIARFWGLFFRTMLPDEALTVDSSPGVSTSPSK